MKCMIISTFALFAVEGHFFDFVHGGSFFNGGRVGGGFFNGGAGNGIFGNRVVPVIINQPAAAAPTFVVNPTPATMMMMGDGTPVIMMSAASPSASPSATATDQTNGSAQPTEGAGGADGGAAESPAPAPAPATAPASNPMSPIIVQQNVGFRRGGAPNGNFISGMMPLMMNSPATQDPGMNANPSMMNPNMMNPNMQ